jgi:hypothetical protein
MMRVRFIVTLTSLCAVFLAGAGTAAGQTTSTNADSQHLAITFGWVPQWDSDKFLSTDVLFGSPDHLALKGNEFRIGVGRGKSLGGDWAVSYIHRRVESGSQSIVEEPHSEVIGNQTFIFSETLTVQDVTFDGIVWDKFVPFATIKQRVQIGMSFGVGVAKIKGTVLRRSQGVDFVRVGNSTVTVPIITEETVDANALLVEEIDYLPLGRIEAAAAFIVIPSVKVRVTGGFNLPGVPAMGVQGVYLFGAR